MTNTAADSLGGRVIRMTPVAVVPSQRVECTELARAIAGTGSKLKLVVEGANRIHDLPLEAGVLLERLLVLLGNGDGVSVVGVSEELTTQQAADLLNVSRQYLVRLLDAGEMPSRRTASHRRVAAVDVLAYKAIRDAKRRKGLQKLTHLTEQLDGYEAEIKIRR